MYTKHTTCTLDKRNRYCNTGVDLPSIRNSPEADARQTPPMFTMALPIAVNANVCVSLFLFLADVSSVNDRPSLKIHLGVSHSSRVSVSLINKLDQTKGNVLQNP